MISEIKILGIETSCDETGVAVVQGLGNRFQVLGAREKGSSFKAQGSSRNVTNLANISNLANEGGNIDFGFRIVAEGLASSVDLQKEYGGVVPELASRVHVEKINLLLAKCLKEAELDWDGIDAIAVANGPGLVGSLLVGTMVAKTLGMILKKPLIAVNHLEGHICSAFLAEKKNKAQVSSSKYQGSSGNVANLANISNIANGESKLKIQDTFPMLVLIVSGGHTELLIMRGFGKYEMLGSTVDDAAGEAFDKAAKILGLEYPGGPSISRQAAKGNFQFSIFPSRDRTAAGNFQTYKENIKRENKTSEYIDFKLPRPMMDSGDFNFSFSGLKTALLYKWKEIQNSKIKTQNLNTDLVNRMAYEFQEAVVEVLVAKTVRASEKFKINRVAIVGGVAANGRLREEMNLRLNNVGRQLIVPPIKYCTDNGVKIAVAGYFKYLQNDFIDWEKLEVRSNWEL